MALGPPPRTTQALAGDRGEHAPGETVAELLGALEREQPACGWILDERGGSAATSSLRQRRERREDAAVAPGDRVDVLPAISGGALTELLVGTKKGLFVLEGEPGAPFEVTARAFAGEPVEYAMRDPRSGRILAGVIPVLRAEDLRRRGPRRGVGAGQGLGLPAAGRRRSSESG